MNMNDFVSRDMVQTLFSSSNDNECFIFLDTIPFDKLRTKGISKDAITRDEAIVRQPLFYDIPTFIS